MIHSKPENLGLQSQLAGVYIQKTRETTDFSYLDRASKILDNVVAADSAELPGPPPAQRNRTGAPRILSRGRGFAPLTDMAPADPWNWGTLGDALIELGEYDDAADAYQKMVSLHPDLASYNRAAWFHFLAGDMPGAIDIMQRAITAGSASPENTAWCIVELGDLLMKSGRSAEAEKVYAAAVKNFPRLSYGLRRFGQSAGRARRDVKAAIASYERAQASTPLPDYAAALYDLYHASGDEKNAEKERDLLDFYDHLSLANGEKANRNLAMAYADHDWHLDRALDLAQGRARRAQGHLHLRRSGLGSAQESSRRKTRKPR